MKKMNDRKMRMSQSGVDCGDYFPSEVKHQKMSRAGEIKGFDYPDTSTQIMRDIDDSVSKTSRNMPKSGFRH